MAENFGLKIGLEGEKEFKSAIRDINSQFKVLASEMNLATSAFDKNDKSVEAVTARNQVLAKEIEAQKGKIETLRSALSNAAESFGENDKRTQAWQIQLNKAQAELNGMERELKTNTEAVDNNGDEYTDTGKKVDKFSDEVDKAADETEKSGDKFKKVGDVLKGIGATIGAACAAIGTAAVAAGKKLVDMAADCAAAGDQVDKQSQALGLSRGAYQEWDYVLSQAGVDIESMSTGMKTLTNKIDDAKNGTASAVGCFDKLGISMDELNSLSREDAFALVVERMQGMEDSTERAALANDLFGKSGQNLTALFNESAESTDELKNKAHELGLVMSDEGVDASVRYTDSMDSLTRSFSAAKNNIVSQLLPGMTDIMDGLTMLISGQEGASEQIMTGAQNLVAELQVVLPGIIDIIVNIATAILEVAPTIITSLVDGILANLPLVINTAASVVSSLLDTIIASAPALMEGALQLVLTLVNGILENLPAIIGAAMQMIATLATGIADALPTLIPTIVETIVLIVQTLIENLPLILDAALQLITGLAQGILNALPILIAALPEIINGIITFLLNSIPQIIETGIQLLTSLVQALPDIIMAIVQAIPQIIDGIITAVIQAIPLIIQVGIDLLISLIQNLPLIITTIVQAIPQIISGIVNGLLGNLDKIIMAGVQLFIAIIKNLPTIIKEIVKAVPQIISGIISAFGSLVGSMADIGKNIVKGLWNGIQGLASWIWDKVSGWAKGLWDGICGFFGIHSPSRKFAWMGQMLVEGLAGSIESDGDKAVDAAAELSQNISDVVEGLSADADKSFSTELDVEVNADSARKSLKGALSGIEKDLGDVNANINTGLTPTAETAPVQVSIPLYLDGNIITSSTSTIQSVRNISRRRAMGVV